MKKLKVTIEAVFNFPEEVTLAYIDDLTLINFNEELTVSPELSWSKLEAVDSNTEEVFSTTLDRESEDLINNYLSLMSFDIEPT